MIIQNMWWQAGVGVPSRRCRAVHLRMWSAQMPLLYRVSNAFDGTLYNLCGGRMLDEEYKMLIKQICIKFTLPSNYWRYDERSSKSLFPALATLTGVPLLSHLSDFILSIQDICIFWRAGVYDTRAATSMHWNNVFHLTVEHFTTGNSSHSN